MTRNWDFVLWTTEGLLAQKYEENTVANARVMRKGLGLITNVVPSWTEVCPIYCKDAIQPSRERNLNFNFNKL